MIDLWTCGLVVLWSTVIVCLRFLLVTRWSPPSIPQTYTVHSDSVWSLIASEDLSVVYSGGRDRAIFRTHLASRTSELIAVEDGPVTALALEPGAGAGAGGEGADGGVGATVGLWAGTPSPHVRKWAVPRETGGAPGAERSISGAMVAVWVCRESSGAVAGVGARREGDGGLRGAQCGDAATAGCLKAHVGCPEDWGGGAGSRRLAKQHIMPAVKRGVGVSICKAWCYSVSPEGRHGWAGA